MSAVHAPARTRTETGAVSLAVLRIATGLLFLWAFVDKAFGLGYATQPKNAWFSGGSPTKGFLSRVNVGPFESVFHDGLVFDAPRRRFVALVGNAALGTNPFLWVPCALRP